MFSVNQLFKLQILFRSFVQLVLYIIYCMHIYCNACTTISINSEVYSVLAATTESYHLYYRVSKQYTVAVKVLPKVAKDQCNCLTANMCHGWGSNPWLSDYEKSVLTSRPDTVYYICIYCRVVKGGEFHSHGWNTKHVLIW